MKIIKIADEHFLLSCIRDLEICDVESTLDRLRSINKHVVIQAVNAVFIAGIEHVIGILQQSVRAKKHGILLSKKIEIDILLRLACTNQIDKALTNIGLRDGTNSILVIAVGRINCLKMIRKYIIANYDIDDNILVQSKSRLKFISKVHSIGNTELDTLVYDGNKLACLLVEHASLL